MKCAKTERAQARRVYRDKITGKRDLTKRVDVERKTLVPGTKFKLHGRVCTGRVAARRDGTLPARHDRAQSASRLRRLRREAEGVHAGRRAAMSGRFNACKAYGFRVRKIDHDCYRLSWTFDRYYAGSRLRWPRGGSRDTDRRGAERFAKRHNLPPITD